MKYQKLLSEFEGQLDALESGNGDVLIKAEKGIVLAEKSIRNKLMILNGLWNTERFCHYVNLFCFLTGFFPVRILFKTAISSLSFLSKF